MNETDIFIDEESRTRKAMNEDGSEGTPCDWWLRSACINDDAYMGFIGYDGNINYGIGYECNGVIPACTIG